MEDLQNTAINEIFSLIGTSLRETGTDSVNG